MRKECASYPMINKVGYYYSSQMPPQFMASFQLSPGVSSWVTSFRSCLASVLQSIIPCLLSAFR